ncbi:MAG: hypothetical protein CSYNP_02259 [Syntrophus sp. SKADARSKE-3]|nr:hypothetical protein [Syntrophus sp. SKADARSKE-3]
MTCDEATIEYPAAVLPADAQIKVSKVSVSESDQDPSLIDMTNAYVISTTSSTKTIELASSATLKLKINPAGFDETTIRIVTWDGYEWSEVPCVYDNILKVVSTTTETVMPYGTRIYLANPEIKSGTNPRERTGGSQIVSQFVAVKVVGEIQGSEAAANVLSKIALQAAADTVPVGRSVYVKSPKGKFTVDYKQVKDPTEAAKLREKAVAVAGYMDNAYEQIVKGMGLKEPGLDTNYGTGKTWTVSLRAMKGVHGTADPGTYGIEVNINDEIGDGLAHTCHHEFTHLCQFKILDIAETNVKESLSWFNETMADGVGYYAQNGRGTIYCLADASMGYFDVRLDADDETMKDDNDHYEYRHFPFISYLLAVYKDTKFKKFFETWYSWKPGSQISTAIMDSVAKADGSLGKAITGRDGIFWDFYRDYFIIGEVFNKKKFLNLPNRAEGSVSAPSPFEITNDNKDKQGVTIVEVSSGVSYSKEFTIQRLAGQVAILRFKGSSPVNLSVTVSSAPGQSVGRIQLNAFKRVSGVLQATGDVEEVSDNSTKTKTYTGVGSDIHDIYLLMTNTDIKANDYKVTVVVTEK